MPREQGVLGPPSHRRCLKQPSSSQLETLLPWALCGDSWRTNHQCKPLRTTPQVCVLCTRVLFFCPQGRKKGQQDPSGACRLVAGSSPTLSFLAGPCAFCWATKKRTCTGPGTSNHAWRPFSPWVRVCVSALRHLRHMHHLRRTSAWRWAVQLQARGSHTHRPSFKHRCDLPSPWDGRVWPLHFSRAL